MGHKKTVVITGASRGIGAATAELFARNGYSICINYLANKRAAENVKSIVDAIGETCILVQADISTSTGVKTLFEAVDNKFGTLDVLINNAGILKQQCKFVELHESRINEIFRVNVTGTILCCKEAVIRMAKSYGGAGGSIVNVSSGAAKSGSPNEYVDYAASKGAIDTLTRGLALEVAGDGIRVNGIRPGMIYTEMHASGGEPNRVDRLSPQIPLQRGGTVEEVAEAIFWLAEKASFTTGTMLDLTGGL